MRRREVAILALVFGLALMVGLMGVLRPQPAVAGPARAIPTPIAATADVGPDWIMLTFIQTDTVTVAQTSPGYNLPSYSVADIQWVLDFTGAETVTCKLQFSNNNVNWADGVDIVAAASADVIDMDQFNLFGRYARVVCTPVGSTAYTVTVRAKVHR